jgi:peroxiredoxin
MATTMLSVGSPVPNFKLKSVDDKFYSLDSFSNKSGIVIVFGCNHCPYVIANEDRLIEIQTDYKENIQILEINSNDDVGYPEDSFDKMKARAIEKGFNFPYLRDDTQEIAKAYGATHTPEIFLINRQRKLVYHGKIDDNWQNPSQVKTKYLRNAIDEMLEGKEISVPETFSIGCTIKWKP